MRSDGELQSVDYEESSEKSSFYSNYFFVINSLLLFSLTIILPYIFVRIFHVVRLLNFVVTKESDKYFPFHHIDFVKNHYFIFNFTDLSNAKEFDLSIAAERQSISGSSKIFSQFTLSKIPENGTESIIVNKSAFFDFSYGKRISDSLHFYLVFLPNEISSIVYLNFTCYGLNIAGFHSQNTFISNQSDGYENINGMIRKISIYFVIILIGQFIFSEKDILSKSALLLGLLIFSTTNQFIDPKYILPSFGRFSLSLFISFLRGFMIFASILMFPFKEKDSVNHASIIVFFLTTIANFFYLYKYYTDYTHPLFTFLCLTNKEWQIIIFFTTFSFYALTIIFWVFAVFIQNDKNKRLISIFITFLVISLFLVDITTMYSLKEGMFSSFYQMNTSQMITLNFFTTFLISCVICLIFTVPYRNKTEFSQLTDDFGSNIIAEAE